METIKHANKILLISHINPDGDTLGSSGAMSFFIEKQLDKPVDLFCVNQIPQNFKFLNLEQFYISPERLDLNSYDLIIALDCADMRRTGIEEQLLQTRGKIPLINIDHHQTNPMYGDLNIVNADTSSTCEIVFNLFKKSNIDFDKNISTCLLTGILTDTSYFTNAATTSLSIKASSFLMNQGVSSKEILESVWKNQKLETLKLWGQVLEKLHFNKKHKIATAIINSQDKVDSNIFEGFANFLTVIYEANIILVLTQIEEKLIKASMRTTKENIDVAKIAAQFGGGGHSKAAGFSLDGQLQETATGWKIV
ncbi:bifunctional oligoribonuclease/PAP phosphatase NrnA, partial [Candidatus Falkowbacteria bacterium]|jgi:bifunctional oligoribonuclease and PAP phosphatase NrnA|nr:bifunctional oligoribonuclease/PAP phosphatase NrnA [Candidatus Falkowbacteria bacterium]